MRRLLTRGQVLTLAITCSACMRCLANTQELPGRLPDMPTPNEQGLSLYLHPEMARYRENAPIYVAVELNNEGDTTRMVCVAFSPALYVLQFRIVDPEGKIVAGPNLVLQHQLTPSDFVQLPPLVYVGDRIDLSMFYSLHQRGRYQVKAVYDAQNLSREAPEETWRGSIESNEIEIVIE